MGEATGTVDLGYAVKNIQNKCIRLKKSIYGNADAALCWYQTYADHTVAYLNLQRNKIDFCVFFKKTVRVSFYLWLPYM